MWRHSRRRPSSLLSLFTVTTTITSTTTKSLVGPLRDTARGQGGGHSKRQVETCTPTRNGRGVVATTATAWLWWLAFEKNVQQSFRNRGTLVGTQASPFTLQRGNGKAFAPAEAWGRNLHLRANIHKKKRNKQKKDNSRDGFLVTFSQLKKHCI